uniref:Uncharacterized protein n=1 Tax=Mustela putorius furo TaxID=9669 RepID=M3Y3Q7_MUSPF
KNIQQLSELWVAGPLDVRVKLGPVVHGLQHGLLLQHRHPAEDLGGQCVTIARFLLEPAVQGSLGVEVGDRRAVHSDGQQVAELLQGQAGAVVLADSLQGVAAFLAAGSGCGEDFEDLDDLVQEREALFILADVADQVFEAIFGIVIRLELPPLHQQAAPGVQPLPADIPGEGRDGLQVIEYLHHVLLAIAQELLAVPGPGGQVEHLAGLHEDPAAGIKPLSQDHLGLLADLLPDGLELGFGHPEVLHGDPVEALSEVLLELLQVLPGGVGQAADLLDGLLDLVVHLRHQEVLALEDIGQAREHSDHVEEEVDELDGLVVHEELKQGQRNGRCVRPLRLAADVLEVGHHLQVVFNEGVEDILLPDDPPHGADVPQELRLLAQGGRRGPQLAHEARRVPVETQQLLQVVLQLLQAGQLLAADGVQDLQVGPVHHEGQAQQPRQRLADGHEHAGAQASRDVGSVDAQAHSGLLVLQPDAQGREGPVERLQVALGAGEAQLLQGQELGGRGAVAAGVLDVDGHRVGQQVVALPVQDDAEAGGLAKPAGEGSHAPCPGQVTFGNLITFCVREMEERAGQDGGHRLH